MFFFYNKFGDNMKIYLDLILILNFAFDFLLLLSVSLILRRNIKLNKIILGAFFGSFSILLLFIKINSFELFLLKIVISILMLLITFGYKNLRYFFKNFVFLYLSSIILGGFLYFLNVTFSYKNNGLVFFYKGLSINFIFLIIFSPIILYIYIKECRNLRNNYSNYYKVNLYITDDLILKLNAFLDTGNKLVDPYKKRNIILVDKKKIIFDINEFKMVLVPYKTVNYDGILKCFKAKKIEINGKVCTNFLVGIMDKSFNIDGVDCIINNKILEG